MKSDLDLIWGYFEGELTEEEMNGVKQRLESDPAFQELFTDQKEIVQSLQKTDLIVFRKKIRMIGDQLRRNKPDGHMVILSYPWLIAAAIGILCLTTGYFLLRLTAGETTSPPPLISSSLQMEDSALSISVDESESADHFTVNAALEELTTIHYRNGCLQSIHPKNGQVFPCDSIIAFTCRIEAAESMTITILNNKAKVILQQKMPSGGFVWGPVHQEGLYYFQLSTDKELLCTRRLFIH